MSIPSPVSSPLRTVVHAPLGTSRMREAITGPPSKVSGVVPVDEATHIQLDQVITWARPAMAQSYDVWIGNGPLALGLASEAQASRAYVYPLLELDTTYYIRIDSKNSFGTTTGDITSFSTWDSASIAFSDDGTTPATDENGEYVETPDT